MKLPRVFTLAEIASLIGGKVIGSPELTIDRIALSPLAAQPGELALFFDRKLMKHIDNCKATAALVPTGVNISLPAITVDRPTLALQKMLKFAEPKRFLPEPGIHPSAVVAPSCQLGDGVAIGPLVSIGPSTKIGANTIIMAGCVIGGEVTIGSNCLLHPGCLVADYVQVGNRVILQQGASLGADGFGYVTEKMSNLERRMSGINELSDEPNPHLKIPQIGTVILEDDVEIGSNTTIDRATIGATVIGQGTKIDNLVMIAHNCQIGKESIIVSMTGLAGSVKVGDRAVIAGHVGVKDHINIGKDAIIEGKAGVMKDLPDQAVVIGSPAFPAREFMSQVAIIRKGPQMYEDLKSLKKKVLELEQMLTSLKNENSKKEHACH